MSVNKEIWQNVTKGNVGLLKLDVRGLEKGVVVPSGGKVTLTVEERRLNQDLAATPPQDLFSNGTLSPVRLVPDTVAEQDPDLAVEYESIKDNPNFISESDMKQMFSRRIDAFKRELEKIENPAVVQRIREMAEEQDAKQSQITAIDERLAAFRPKNLVEVEVVGRAGANPQPSSP